MSIPTLRNDLAKLYEPSAPAPSRRLETLKRAVQEGIPVYVALAPTPAEVDEADVRATLTELKQLDPITIFAEPINIRAENVKRIAAHAREVGLEMNTAVFDPNERWVQYAVDQLLLVEKVAKELEVADRLHLWPDKSFKSNEIQKRIPWLKQHQDWFYRYWTRISDWPGRTLKNEKGEKL
jgi:DNA repair photolyase